MKVDGSLIHFAFSLGPTPALKQITRPVNRMTTFGVQLKFLYQLMFEFHLYQSSWFIRFSVVKVPWLQVSSMAKVIIS